VYPGCGDDQVCCVPYASEVLVCEPDPPADCQDLIDMGSTWVHGCCAADDSGFWVGVGIETCDLYFMECANGCCPFEIDGLPMTTCCEGG
jgi:hypothetical protein